MPAVSHAPLAVAKMVKLPVKAAPANILIAILAIPRDLSVLRLAKDSLNFPFHRMPEIALDAFQYFPRNMKRIALLKRSPIDYAFIHAHQLLRTRRRLNVQLLQAGFSYHRIFPC